VLDLIVDHAWNNGEPGIIFIDTVNRFNPTPDLGEIESTNPCGEVPLLPYESCNLGSINLSCFYDKETNDLDFERLSHVIKTAVRFLDDIIDVNKYPLARIAEMTRSNRKIGLGVMGFADLLVQMGVPYNSDKAVQVADNIMNFIQQKGKNESKTLAKERGNYPNYPGSGYMRNATVTTIAPTGSISLIAGCSSGIEPHFALVYVKRCMDGNELLEINPYFEGVAQELGFYSEDLMRRIAETGSVQGLAEVPENIQKVFVTSLDIAPEWHVQVQAAFQKHTDNAVSKTINFPNEATKADVKQAYIQAYNTGCKGLTVYRDRSRDEQVLNILANQPDVPEGVTPRSRPQITQGATHRVRTGCGNMYVTVNRDDLGFCEIFITMGKAGGCAPSQLECIGRLASLCLRAGVDPQAVVKNMRGIACHNPGWSDTGKVTSCADAVGLALQACLADMPANDFAENRIGACPECGSQVEYHSGCLSCRYCGYSKCG
jgi:ribonucleoside-diphosphate reductase alpha chain